MSEPKASPNGITPGDTEIGVVRGENLGRSFDVGGQTIHALQDVSFTVGRGNFVAIVGRSGSGKTTLLNLIAGLDKPSQGHVYVEGHDIAAMNESQITDLRRHRIGFVFQSFGLLPLLSAYENVEIALRIGGAGIRERGQRTREVLEMVGLTRRAHHRPYELSGGEQQRVAIARALANRPAIVLADEPTGELDSSTAATIFQLLLDIVATEKVTIITTTHDRYVISKAQRVLELADGALLPERSVEERDRPVSFSLPRSPSTGPELPHSVHEDEPTVIEDDGRWARPTQRPGIYQPPPPPNAPLV